MNEKSYHSFLKILAYVGVLTALFPLAVAAEVLGAGSFTVWHFFLLYGVWILFRGFGTFVGVMINRLERRRKPPKKVLALLYFLMKAGFVVPSAIFLVIGINIRLSVYLCFFSVVGGIIIYFGGCMTVGKSYSDIFSKAWLVLYTISSIVLMAMFAVTTESPAVSLGRLMLCIGFAVMVMLSAVIINQANIDACTNQRDRGKTVLPNGLRRYNALLGVGIFALVFVLFAFARPIAVLFRNIAGVFVRGFIYIIDHLPQSDPHETDGFSVNETGDAGMFGMGGAFSDTVVAFFAIVLIIFIIIFIKPITAGIKNVISFLFRKKANQNSTPFADEITKSKIKPPTKRMERKEERAMERRYSRETSPSLKFRLGYELFLMKLSRTQYPPKPSDTAEAHIEKGERAFGEEFHGLSETYNKVRYADIQPTAEELAAQSELLKRLK